MKVPTICNIFNEKSTNFKVKREHDEETSKALVEVAKFIGHSKIGSESVILKEIEIKFKYSKNR